ncbi:amidohydrolase [Mammaliicoccus sciuri]|uniref:Imidazolonepropionase n=1 Tax=Sporosarcina newyorkensis TaxID=759851 RepID=A0A1T4YA96_9BACL|nr:amidohydrolase [Sporosarcina newyorkensis]SKA98709.1 Imidazolonepropionase [Sporosarcina newyorkensis]
MLTVLRNGTVYTMNQSNEVLQNADIWVCEGKITKIGKNTDLPSDAQVIDCTGQFITPGLIDAHTHVGLWAEVTERQNDANEYSSPWTPLMNAKDGIDPRHFSFEQAVMGGVTTVQTGAGSANPIGGVWSILKTAGASFDDRILIERSGLKGALGENPKNVFGNQYKTMPMTRMAVAHLIRKGFNQVLQLKDSERDQLSKDNSALAPFVEVLERKMPLRLHCHRADDIATAIRIAKEYNVKLSLEHCTEGMLMLDTIKASGATVTLGPYMTPATKYENRFSTAKSPKHFHETGIPFAIMTDHPFIPIQYLYYCVVEAVKNGLDELAGLESITCAAAAIMGIADKVGSVEKGKDADFAIWSHKPFETKANVLATYIEGKEVYRHEGMIR